VGGVRFIFVDNSAFYDREHLYGPPEADYPDNAERFAFLARSAIEWASQSGLRHDVVHAHDWQSALVPVLLGRKAPTVFTIHNLAYQGMFDPGWLPRIGLPPDLMHVDALEYWGKVSFLKGGIVFSRIITTVSPRYAEEIQTAEAGFGFEGLLRSRSRDLVGILNGIDYDQWNPSADPYLPEPFDAEHLEKKTAAKRALLRDVGLPDDEVSVRRPVIGMVSRLVDQKGFDLLAEIPAELMQLQAVFVVLGSGERRYEDLWRGLAAAHPDRVAARFGFDEALAHRIEGGADIFLMPSKFEPCGLNQMYSLRYGTVPVVRATGGLYDTVHDVDSPNGQGTGFVFREYEPAALLTALQRALARYEDTQAWRSVQKAGMRQDFSWGASAREYLTVYERAKIG
jgi:starch synthase